MLSRTNVKSALTSAPKSAACWSGSKIDFGVAARMRWLASRTAAIAAASGGAAGDAGADAGVEAGADAEPDADSDATPPRLARGPVQLVVTITTTSPSATICCGCQVVSLMTSFVRRLNRRDVVNERVIR